ncbi:MAG TPA: hypothetical protein VLL54_19900 [Pyrinomonadaceae bacterium]|nr:hypothetical protein [Pyrinomonadaceae bacterium]
MRKSATKRNLLAVMLMGLLLLVVAPATSFGQGRHGNRDWNNGSWRNGKCGKFVNCHDARNGRWDGRGARGDRVGYVFWRNRNRTRSFNRNRNLTLQRRAWWRNRQNRN